MKVWLQPHPTTPAGPVISLRSYVSRKGADWLALDFIVAGEIDKIAWPGTEPSGYEGWQRSDELWKHTCFEVFGRVDNAPGYYELNFATSARWAAYGFAEYREGMRQAEDISLTVGRWFIRERQAKLEAVVQIPHEFSSANWEIGLSAVIEEKSGAKSYWALAHPLGKPDFHHPSCFTAMLPPPAAS